MTTMMMMTMGSAGALAAKGVVALALTAGVASLLREAPASHRHLVWAAGLATLLALPLLTVAGPSVPVSLPGWAGSDVGAGAAAAVDGPEVRGVPAVVVRPEVAAGAAHEPEAFEGEVPATSRPRPAHAPSSVGVGEPGADGSGRGVGIGAFLLALWLTGTTGLLARVVVGHRAARRLVRAAVPAPAHVVRRSHELAAGLGIRRAVAVRVHRALRIPVVVGVARPTVVLPAGFDGWGRATLDHVLLHELAHVRRWDPLLHAAADVVRALHWVNPLVWVAVRRLRLESERACDDRVVARSAASAYAEDLLRVARDLRAGSTPPAAVAMARSSDLAVRLHAILDAGRPRHGVGPGAAFAAMVAAAVVAVPLAGLTSTGPEPSAGPDPMPVEVRDAGPTSEPGVLAPAAPLPAPGQEAPRLCAFRERDGGISRRIDVDEDRYDFRFEQGDCRVEIRLAGDVTFGTDDRSVVSMGAGAVLDIEERDGERRWRIRLRGTDAGIEYRYDVDGNEVAWGADARARLGAVLPELFRQTSLNAEARVVRILAEGGVDGVLAEVDRIPADAVARRYVELLVETADLSEDQAVRILRRASTVQADHHKASLLAAMAREQGLGTRRLQDPFLDAVLTIQADHHVRNVLEILLEQQGLTPEQLDRVVAAAGRMGADHHKAEVLTRVVRRGGLGTAGRASFMAALRTVGADHHRRAVVEAFLDGVRLEADERVGVLELAGEIGSDHHRAAVLARLATGYDLGEVEADAFVRAAAGIGADHHVRAVAETLIDRGDLGETAAAAVLHLAGTIESDHHRLAVLEALAARTALDGRLRDWYLGLAGDLDSRRARSAREALDRGRGR
ncbi:MAG: M56 family metallopeptidase [Longimicrobiales bacterium]